MSNSISESIGCFFESRSVRLFRFDEMGVGVMA